MTSKTVHNHKNRPHHIPTVEAGPSSGFQTGLQTISPFTAPQNIIFFKEMSWVQTPLMDRVQMPMRVR